jgi:hypothetical protein
VLDVTDVSEYPVSRLMAHFNLVVASNFTTQH